MAILKTFIDICEANDGLVSTVLSRCAYAYRDYFLLYALGLSQQKKSA